MVRRGKPSIILSDNVTIFKGADREIQNGTAKVRSFIDDLSQNNILGVPKFDEQLSSTYNEFTFVMTN
jgi:hypothetical protein